MKLSPFSAIVAVAGALVDSARFVEVGLSLHGSTWPLWNEWRGVIHGISSGAFGLTMAGVIIVAADAIAATRSRGLAVALIAMLVASVASATGAISGATDGALHVLLNLCAVVAPTLAVVIVPIAHVLRETPVVAPVAPPEMPGIALLVDRLDDLTQTIANSGRNRPVATFEVQGMSETPQAPQIAKKRGLTATERSRAYRQRKRITSG